MPIPREVLSDTLRKLLTGRRVTAGVFTTFSLEPQFFEEEIVSLLADGSLHSEPKLRMLQLEELLNSEIGPISVYYDRQGLRADGAKRLNVSYVPVHVANGVFHPKLVLLLTRPTDASADGEPSLVCGVLSSNLTRGGWWSLLECAHFETVKGHSRCSFKGDLQELLRDIGRLAGPEADSSSLDAIAGFVRGLEGFEHATQNGRLRPRIVAGTKALSPFLLEARGLALSGTTLEVLSPFFDEHRATPLRDLVKTLEPDRTFVYLPRGDDGAVSCSKSVYEDAQGIQGVKWAQFREEDSLFRLGKDKHAKRRSLHAKVYRFTRRQPGFELLVVGSHNLTTPALARGKNFEASFVFEADAEGKIEPWLQWDEKRPRKFAEPDPAIKAELPAGDCVMPLQVKFDWIPPESCKLLWEGASASGPLQLEYAGAQVVRCASMSPSRWHSLSPADTEAVRSRLISSALLTVRGENGEAATILVQETGMHRKPPILLTLSPEEVLSYWARLTPEQRTLYWEERLAGRDAAALTGEGIELPPPPIQKSMFATYSGIFHGFEMLRERLEGCLAAGDARQAQYLLFGDRPSSLPRLLRDVRKADAKPQDIVSLYLIVLSARQLFRWLKKEHREFLRAHPREVIELEALVREADALRSQLDVGPDRVKFLNWFESHFVRRARAGRAHD